MSIRTYSERNMPLRRPHEPAFRKQISSEPSSQASPNILSLFQLISSVNPTQPRELKKCVELFDYLSKTDELAQTVIRQLHAHLLIDGSSSICRRMALFIAESLKTDSKRFSSPVVRAEWLSLLQENFEKREELANKIEVFLNAVQFHGEIFSNLLVRNEPLKIMAGPLLNYLKMLLKTPSKEQMRVVLLQLAINLKNLAKDAEYGSFLVQLRKAMLRGNSNELLLAIEITSENFPVPGSPLHGYYSEFLGELFREVECAYHGIEWVQPESPPLLTPRPIQTSTPLDEQTNGSYFAASEESKMKQAVGILASAEAVRERMRSKGLLPSRPAGQSQGILRSGSSDGEQSIKSKD